MEPALKYPDSYRLDHPIFGDVYKTVYKKGVITEFQKLQDDPIVVASMVKVAVDGEEVGDYLPLFYHPRKEYWDSESGAALDFDGDMKTFAASWMSFRADDEVMVRFNDGKAEAVIGSAAGPPRPGENIIRLSLTTYPFEYHTAFTGSVFDQSRPAEAHSFYINCLKRALDAAADGPEPSPDGLDLGLTESVIKLLYREWQMIGTYPAGGWDVGSSDVLTFFMADWAIPVGPLLYVLQFTGRYDVYNLIGAPGGATLYSRGQNLIVDGMWAAALLYSEKALTELKGAANSSGLSPFDAANKAVAMSKGRFGPWGIDYPGAVKQTDLFNSLVDNPTGLLSNMDPKKTTFAVRPHNPAFP